MVKQCMCGMCMSYHAMSRACHYSDGMAHDTDKTVEIMSHIVHILKPSRKDSILLVQMKVWFWRQSC